MNEQLPVVVSSDEQEKISRALLAWLNEFPDKPVSTINYEYLADDQAGMALSAIQGTFKTKTYIRRGYQAQYQFKVIYRIQTGPGAENSTRLSAEEMLNKLGSWASTRRDFPDIGERKYVQKIDFNARSALFGRYDNGDEDHQILMTLYYVSM